MNSTHSNFTISGQNTEHTPLLGYTLQPPPGVLLDGFTEPFFRVTATQQRTAAYVVVSLPQC
jgi:hypothetical protein